MTGCAPTGAKHDAVRVRELARSLSPPAMGRDVSAIRAEDTQFLNLRIQDGEASAAQRHESLQIGESVRSGAFEGADAEFLDKRPSGRRVRRRDVRDVDRAGRQRVPQRGPVASGLGVPATGQRPPHHGDQYRLRSFVHLLTPSRHQRLAGPSRVPADPLKVALLKYSRHENGEATSSSTGFWHTLNETKCRAGESFGVSARLRTTCTIPLT